MTSTGSAGPLDLAFSLVAETNPPPGVDEAGLERLVRFVLKAEGATGAWEVTAALVDDPRLQALHRDFMGLDTPTDIMTFPIVEPGEEAQGGELVVSVDHARSQASEWGHTLAEEIAFLVIHGLLHLLGWRDDDDGQRRRMLARQEELFDRWRTASG